MIRLARKSQIKMFPGSPRLRPLASCLAAALAFSAPSVLFASEADNNALLNEARTLLLDSVPSGEAMLSQLSPAEAARVDMAMQRILGLDNLGAVLGATIPVSNCNNSGSGSLRAAVALASTGDTVDMSGLGCNTITLLTSIVTSANDLTFVGNPNNKYPILNGDNLVEPIVHFGTGTLTLSGVTVQAGKFEINSAQLAAGGCIYSRGNVVLEDSSRVKYCLARNTGTGLAVGGGIYSRGYTTVLTGSIVSGNDARAASAGAKGGGIYAKGGVTTKYGTVFGNDALTTSGAFTRGGGIYSAEGLTAKYSTISGNGLTGSALDVGGGAWITGTSVIAHSTISDNVADAASAMLLGRAGTGTTGISSSTIADNEARASNAKYGGGVYLGNASTIRNTTISGNIERNVENEKYGAGILINTGVSLTMSSTIASGNVLIDTSSNSFASDIRGNETTPATITGDHNLVGNSKYATTPGDTIANSSPLLGPLRNNGGFTETMAVLTGSPTINKGVTNSFTTDQRGPGFARTFGSAPDIGAFELGGDRIFANGFD